MLSSPATCGCAPASIAFEINLSIACWALAACVGGWQQLETIARSGEAARWEREASAASEPEREARDVACERVAQQRFQRVIGIEKQAGPFAVARDAGRVVLATTTAAAPTTTEVTVVPVTAGSPARATVARAMSCHPLAPACSVTATLVRIDGAGRVYVAGTIAGAFTAHGVGPSQFLDVFGP